MLAFALLTLLPFVAAQSNSALEISAIKAHFNQSGIVPSLLPTFNPTALLTINFAGVGDLTPGQLLTPEQTAPTPTISFTPANSSVKLDGNFTIFMVDADIAGTTDPNVNRHWLVNGVTVQDNKLSNSSATAITSYAGPGPSEGSGPHRYVIILYQQPAEFIAPADFRDPIGVTKMNLQTYVLDSKLGPVVAANYMTVEAGTATVTPSSTAPVVSSTLTAPTGSGSSGSGNGTATGQGSTPSNAASQLTLGGSAFLAFLSSILMLA
ncbi:PEBP-like protein [Marasmius fiardii PR-910]|nr:PEBP-like protein [Marasmius fiardii PR-910]